MKEQTFPTPQAAEGRSLIAKNFKHSQEYLYNSAVSRLGLVSGLTGGWK